MKSFYSFTHPGIALREAASPEIAFLPSFGLFILEASLTDSINVLVSLRNRIQSLTVVLSR